MSLKEKALQSIIREATGLIRRNEGNYAKSVIADFNDAIQLSDNPSKTAYQWLQDYRNPGHRKSAPFLEKFNLDTPEHLYDGRSELGWTPYKPSKNSEFWDWTNILLDQQRYGKIAATGFKLEILKKMTRAFDEELRDNFRRALCQVLRYEKSQDIRREAIYLLATHFSWNTIEWTFWLHETRRKEDAYILIGAEAWCKSNVKDAKTLRKIVRKSVTMLIEETI